MSIKNLLIIILLLSIIMFQIFSFGNNGGYDETEVVTETETVTITETVNRPIGFNDPIEITVTNCTLNR